jgi:trans-aconitate methyltransferase
MDNRETAWFNTDKLPKEMVNGALGLNGWAKLENTEHFKVLDDMVKLCNFTKIADIGCGAGELGRIYHNYEYTGFDLSHIIQNVSKIVNVNLHYRDFNADEFDYSEFNNYDLLICNSFISELTNPLEILEKIIKNTNKFLIIHRQFFSNSEKNVEYTTYGNLKTIRSFISQYEFESLLSNHQILKQVSNQFGETVLIKKIL